MEKRRYAMVRHAYRTVPYYRKKFEQNFKLFSDIERDEGWESLPLTEKAEITMEQEQLISQEYLGAMITGHLIRSHTSGSTGTYLDVYWNQTDYTASLVPLWMERYKYAGIHTKDRVCIFNTTLKNHQEYQIRQNQMLISKQNLTTEKLVFLFEAIYDFNPVWFLLHPGIAMMLLQSVKGGRLSVPTSLKYIELTGEMVLEGLKTELEQIFRCKVRCHYGTMEVNTIGVEEKGRYRVFQNSTYVEVIDSHGKVMPDGEYGNIYVTSLHNKVMPIIRYGLGDIGRIITDCNGEQRIELKQARKNDMLLLTDGRHIPPDVFLGPIEKINQAMGLMIYQFQVVQQNFNSLVLKVVLDPEMGKEEFVGLYQELFNESWKYEFDWKYEFNKTIQLNQTTGKYGWFVNLSEQK